MNEFEITRTDAADRSAAEDLDRHCAGLERQATYSLAALVVLSCSLCVFIGIQWKQARSELANVKPAATRIIQIYQREKPDIDARLARLAEYGRTHPDFVPILSRFRIAVPAATAPGATSAPPRAAAPKPAPPARK